MGALVVDAGGPAPPPVVGPFEDVGESVVLVLLTIEGAALGTLLGMYDGVDDGIAGRLLGACVVDTDGKVLGIDAALKAVGEPV